MSDQVLLTYEEAVSRLPDGDEIHTFRNPNGMLIGADWDRQELLSAMKAAEKILVAGRAAQAMHHGLAILNDQGRLLFIETRAKPDGGAE